MSSENQLEIFPELFEKLESLLTLSNTLEEEKKKKPPMNWSCATGLRLWPKPYKERCTIVVKLREFSNLSIHTPGGTSQEFIDYEISSNLLKVHYTITVYPNGRDSSTEGYVSVAFVNHQSEGKLPSRILSTKLSGVIAIMDTGGNHRLPQSFEIFHDFSEKDPGPSLFIHDHISRSVLLNDPSEWLTQDDTLTLHMDVKFRQSYTSAYSAWDTESFESVNSDFETDFGPDGSQTQYLSLDTHLAQRLAEESTYFQRLQVTPMMERRSGRVRIPADEYPKFITIGRIFFDGGPILFDTVNEIFDVYEIAEKYDIAIVLDTCRYWLKLCLSIENALEISEFAERYGDVCLRESVQPFLTEEENGIKCVKDAVGSQASSKSKLWTFTKRDSEPGSRFEYRLIGAEEVEKNPKDDYEFYS